MGTEGVFVSIKEDINQTQPRILLLILDGPTSLIEYLYWAYSKINCPKPNYMDSCPPQVFLFSHVFKYIVILLFKNIVMDLRFSTGWQ